MASSSRDPRRLRLLLAQKKARLARHPLAYAVAWHQEAPRTSQRTALHLAMPGHLMTLILGGNRTGKSEIMAQWGLANAAGRDAYIDTPAGRRYWVREWMKANDLPEEMIPEGPGTVWFGSPSFGASLEQIRPKLTSLAPVGTAGNQWTQSKEARLFLPVSGDSEGKAGTADRNGGVLVSKAYKQYDQDPQSWEGANVRAICLDEQPTTYACIAAALSRLVDQRGRLFMALTPLRGKDWLYQILVLAAPEWLRVYTLHGADNPHIPQDMRRMMLAAMPEWQRQSRDVGAFCSPEGACYSFDRGAHVIPRMPIPSEWPRFMSVDWGVKNPSACWLALRPDGALVVYREVAIRKKATEPQVPTDVFLQILADAVSGTPEGGRQVVVYGVADSADPDAIARASSFGFTLSPALKGDGSVRKGIELVEARLCTVHPTTLERQMPRLLVTEDCPYTISELEGLKWGPQVIGQEARPDPACPDHNADCVRYAVRYADELGFR